MMEQPDGTFDCFHVTGCPSSILVPSAAGAIPRIKIARLLKMIQVGSIPWERSGELDGIMEGVKTKASEALYPIAQRLAPAEHVLEHPSDTGTHLSELFVLGRIRTTALPLGPERAAEFEAGGRTRGRLRGCRRPAAAGVSGQHCSDADVAPGTDM